MIYSSGVLIVYSSSWGMWILAWSSHPLVVMSVCCFDIIFLMFEVFRLFYRDCLGTV
jgi:hypothetical protein